MVKEIKTKFCKYCKKIYQKNPEISNIQWKNTKFCSEQCRYKFMKGKRAPVYIDGRSLKKYKCVSCDNTVNWQTAIKGKGMCIECMTKLYRIIFSGKNNPFYGKCHTDEAKNKISKTRIFLGLAKGKNNPAYIDGESKRKYPREFTNDLKLKIFKRDNYTCQKCGIYPCNDLTNHHIDYDKKNCKEDNLITLCRKCNSKVNTNRNHWKMYFSKLLRKGEINERITII